MSYRSVAHWVLLAGVGQFALLAVPAQAQDQADQGSRAAAQQSQNAVDAQPGVVNQGRPEGADAAGGIQDIVVTANRQAQNLQKVSAAVQVIDGAKLRTQALSNVEQVFADVPSVQVTAQPAGFNVDIRGQASDQPASSSQGSVAVEFDGVYNIQSYATTVGFFDTDRIEVLPGPQSTRYGPNAKGGVVNIISKDPVLGSLAGQGAFTAGNYGLFRGEIAQNIPLTDTLALRVAGAAIHRNSYFKPATGNAIAQSVRVKLLFQPNDRLTVKGQYELDHIGGTGAGNEPSYASFVAAYNDGSINNYSNPWRHGDYSTGCQPLDTANDANNNVGNSNYGNCSVADSHANIYQRTAIGNIGYRFTDWAALDVTQSYIEETGTDLSCSPSGGYPQVPGGLHNCYLNHPFEPFYSWSTEARLHSVAGNKVLWNLGFYHWNYRASSYGAQRNGSAATAGIAGTATNAVFGDVTYPVIDRFRLIAGLRGSKDMRIYRPGMNNLNMYDAHFKHVDYRAGEEFDITPTSMEYFTVSTGYEPGSLSTGSANPGQTPPLVILPNEVVTAFEFGLKNRFFDNKLQVNADVFRYVQKNYAFNTPSYYNYTTSGGFYCAQAQPGTQPDLRCVQPHVGVNAHTLGLEAQVRFNPTRNDTFGLNGTWLRARYDKKQGVCDTEGLADAGVSAADIASGECFILTNLDTGALHATPISGQTQDHAPKFAGNFSYTHTFRFASGATFDVGGEVFHSSSFWVMPVYDSRENFQPGYTQESATVSFTPANSIWSLSAYIRNISNYAVKTSALPDTTIGDPRTFGGTLSLKW